MPPTILGKTGFELTVPIGMGCWQLGGCWSAASDEAAHRAALTAYLESGGNFLDTANVYGGDHGTVLFGWSERVIGEVLKARAPDAPRVYVATKAGRAPTTAAPGDHGPERYTYQALSESLSESASRLGVEVHLPHTSHAHLAPLSPPAPPAQQPHNRSRLSRLTPLSHTPLHHLSTHLSTNLFTHLSHTFYTHLSTHLPHTSQHTSSTHLSTHLCSQRSPYSAAPCAHSRTYLSSQRSRHSAAPCSHSAAPRAHSSGCRPAAAALSAHLGARSRLGRVGRAREAAGGGPRVALGRVCGDGRGSVSRDRTARLRDCADHFQHAPDEAGGRVLGRRQGEGRRLSHPPAARIGPPLGQGLPACLPPTHPSLHAVLSAFAFPYPPPPAQVDAAYLANLEDGDHRKFNSAGAAFDKGETWSGLGEHMPDVALPAVAELQAVHAAAAGRGECPPAASLAQFALRWCLDVEGVSVVIPGARNAEQAVSNLAAAALGPLSAETHAAVKAVYDAKVKAVVEKEKW